MPCWVLHLDSTSAVGDIHVFHVILLKICYVISDKQKYISLVVVVSSSSSSSSTSVEVYYILLMPIFYLSGESPLSTFPL